MQQTLKNMLIVGSAALALAAGAIALPSIADARGGFGGVGHVGGVGGVGRVGGVGGVGGFRTGRSAGFGYMHRGYVGGFNNCIGGRFGCRRGF
jgi:hypothetical protein